MSVERDIPVIFFSAGNQNHVRGKTKNYDA